MVRAKCSVEFLDCKVILAQTGRYEADANRTIIIIMIESKLYKNNNKYHAKP
jgi:hypothetical protein